jgi:hypothetical protein
MAAASRRYVEIQGGGRANAALWLRLKTRDCAATVAQRFEGRRDVAKVRAPRLRHANGASRSFEKAGSEVLLERRNA